MRPLTKLPSVAARTFPVVGPHQRRRRPLSNWRRSVSISSHGSSEDPTQTSSSDPSCINWLTALLFWQFNLEVVLLFRAFMTDWLTDWVYHGFARCKLKFDLSRRSAYRLCSRSAAADIHAYIRTYSIRLHKNGVNMTTLMTARLNEETEIDSTWSCYRRRGGWSCVGGDEVMWIQCWSSSTVRRRHDSVRHLVLLVHRCSRSFSPPCRWRHRTSRDIATPQRLMTARRRLWKKTNPNQTLSSTSL